MMSALVVLVLLACASVELSLGFSVTTLEDVRQNSLDSWFNTSLAPVRFSTKELAWYYSLRVIRAEEEPPIGESQENVEGVRVNRTHDQGPVLVAPNILTTRKEYRQLTTTERRRLRAALEKMRTTKADEDMDRSEYEIFVLNHRFSMSPPAHGGFAFLPWHREYLQRFERALQKHQPKTFLPYWDSELDHSLPEPRDSVLWSGSLLGNNDGPVTSGLAAYWKTIPECEVGGVTVTRNTPASAAGLLFSQAEVNDLLSKKTYTDVVKGKFERDHGGPHGFVSGHMGGIPCAPSDPAFFMHHAYIDCLWETWRKKRQTREQRATDYPDPGNAGNNKYHRPTATMRPFNDLQNIDGMSNAYTDIHYKYAQKPSDICCFKDSQCRSRFLFCHHGRCMSKVKIGGNCTNLPDRACYSRISPVACAVTKCRYFPFVTSDVNNP